MWITVQCTVVCKTKLIAVNLQSDALMQFDSAIVKHPIIIEFRKAGTKRMKCFMKLNLMQDQ